MTLPFAKDSMQFYVIEKKSLKMSWSEEGFVQNYMSSEKYKISCNGVVCM